MTRNGYLLAALVLCLLLMAGTALAGSCKDATVIEGDAEADVATKCGEPTFKDERAVAVEDTDQDGTRTKTTTIIDEWTYDAGPDELMQTYRFENNKLAEIKTIGYGRLNGVTNDTCRNGELLSVGDSMVETYLKCGEPLAKEKKEDKVTMATEGGTTRRTSVSVVDFIYRYGRDLPGYAVRFENGIATKITPRKFGE